MAMHMRKECQKEKDKRERERERERERTTYNILYGGQHFQVFLFLFYISFDVYKFIKHFERYLWNNLTTISSLKMTANKQANSKNLCPQFFWGKNK